MTTTTRAAAHRTMIEKASARLPVYGYIGVCLTAFCFCYLAVNSPSIYLDLEEEDSLVENLTAIWLFLAGFLLIVTAFMERRAYLSFWIYILSGIAFLFAAGEEISWGQRIFGFHTPDIFMDLNSQHEFNIHNIQALRPFLQTEYYGTLLFCIMVYAAYFYRKETILGVPLPSIPLMFSFTIMLSHRPVEYGFVWLAFFISSPVIVLLLLYITCMLFDRQTSLVAAGIATLIPVSVVLYVYSDRRGSDFIIHPIEVREYLFGFCCLLYSLELLLNKLNAPRPAPRRSSRPARGAGHGDGSAAQREAGS